MAFGLKYKVESYRWRSKKSTIVLISQDNYNGAVTTLAPDRTDSFNLSTGKDSFFKPTIGITAELGVVANSLQLQELFTTNEQEFKVQVYDSTTGSTPFYQGFVTSEIFNQNYIRSSNLNTTVKCWDGMGVLGTIFYTPTADLTTISTTKASAVITNILSKLKLTYTYIYTNSTLLLSGQTTNHLFDNIYVDERNYIDESGKYKSCREVLDAIIQPFGLNMYFRNNCVYLIDPLNLHTVQGKIYNLNDYSYSTTTSIGGNVDLSGTTLDYGQTGQQLDIMPQKKSASIVYSPYYKPNINYDFNSTDNWNSLITSFNIQGTAPNQCYLNSAVSFKDWVVNNGTYVYERGTYEVTNSPSSDANNAEYYLAMYKSTNHDGALNMWTYNDTASIITASANLMMSISFDVMIHSGDLIDIYHSTKTVDVQIAELGLYIKIGNLYYNRNGSGNYWTTTPALTVIPVYAKDKSIITDKWTTASASKLLLHQNTTGALADPNGYLNVIITDYLVLASGYGNLNGISTVLFKNFKVDFFNDSGKPLQLEDIKMTGTLDSTALTELSPINTIHGTSQYGIARGNFRDVNNNLVISGYTNDGSNYYQCEKILLQNVVSQYKYPRFQLSANVTTSLQNTTLDIFYSNTLISDNKYLSNKNFIIMSGDYYDYNENIEGIFLELTKTKDTI
jgi:hypothetical protein